MRWGFEEEEVERVERGRRGEFVGSSMVVMRGVRGVRGMRRSRVHATSIGIFCVANERLKEALVSVTVTRGG